MTAKSMPDFVNGLLGSYPEMVHCPNQPGRLKISKEACIKRTLLGQRTKNSNENTLLLTGRKSLGICRRCPIGRQLAFGPAGKKSISSNSRLRRKKSLLSPTGGKKGGYMDYEKLLHAVQELGFIPDPKAADAAVKAVLGILASAMNEDLAREFTESLPGPLTYDRLRGHQAKPLKIDADRYAGELASQFGLSEEQGRLLITRVLALAREQAENPEVKEIIYTLEQDLG